MEIRPAQPFNAFVEGRRARQQEQYGNTRNALAQMELQHAPQEMQNRNRLLDLQVKGAERAERQHSQEQISQALKQTAAGALRIAQSRNPKAEAAQFYPEFVSKLTEQGIDLNSMSDDEARQYFEFVAGQAQSKLGIAPTSKLETIQGPGGSLLQRDPVTGEMKQVVAREPTQSAPRDERLVQVADASGNPTWVRESDAVGKPAYVARDKPAAADLKYQREVKTKLPRLAAAERRIERLSSALTNVAGNKMLDGGPLDAKALRYTKQGQEVVQAAAALLPELTALTRVPGIGSQSDLETRLANLQLPSLEFAPEVNAKALEELRTFISDLKDAYTSASDGNEPAQQVQQPESNAGQAPAEAIEYLRQNPQFKGAFRQKYGYLPPDM